jgi:hypothetical protein
MKRQWNAEELVEHWTLLPSEQALLANKTGTTRLGFAVLLKFFQYEARFPIQAHEVPGSVVAHIAQQVEIPAEAFAAYDWQGRTIKYHRQQIRTLFGFRELTAVDTDNYASSRRPLTVSPGSWALAHTAMKKLSASTLLSTSHRQCRND